MPVFPRFRRAVRGSPRRRCPGRIRGRWKRARQAPGCAPRPARWPLPLQTRCGVCRGCWERCGRDDRRASSWNEAPGRNHGPVDPAFFRKRPEREATRVRLRIFESCEFHSTNRGRIPMFFNYAAWNRSGIGNGWSVSRQPQKRGGLAPASFMNQVSLEDRSGSVPAAAKETESTQRTEKRGGGLGDCGSQLETRDWLNRTYSGSG